MNDHLTLFHVKQSDFQNIKWLLSYTKKCTKKRQKTGFRRNAIIPNQQIFIIQNLIRQFKTDSHIVFDFSNLYLLN